MLVLVTTTATARRGGRAPAVASFDELHPAHLSAGAAVAAQFLGNRCPTGGGRPSVDRLLL